MAMVFSSVSVKLRAGTALELLDLLDGLVDLFDRRPSVARDGLVVVLLEVVEVVVDDRHLELVEAEHLGLDPQALAEVARADADGIELLDDARAPRARLRGRAPASARQVLDGEVGRSRAVRRARRP